MWPNCSTSRSLRPAPSSAPATSERSRSAAADSGASRRPRSRPTPSACTSAPSTRTKRGPSRTDARPCPIPSMYGSAEGIDPGADGTDRGEGNDPTRDLDVVRADELAAPAQRTRTAGDIDGDLRVFGRQPAQRRAHAQALQSPGLEAMHPRGQPQSADAVDRDDRYLRPGH